MTYNQCTFEGNQPGETEPWCSTRTDSSGNHIGGQGNWGFCPSNCGTVGPTSPPGTFPPAARCSRIGNSYQTQNCSKNKHPPCTGSTNPEETGDYFEGDIKLTGGSSKVFTNDPSERWPSGVVPYVIEGSFGKEPMHVIQIERESTSALFLSYLQTRVRGVELIKLPRNSAL